MTETEIEELRKLKVALSRTAAILGKILGDTQDEVEDEIAETISMYSSGISISDLIRVSSKFKRLTPTERAELLRAMIIAKKIRKEERFLSETARKPATFLFAEQY